MAFSVRFPQDFDVEKVIADKHSRLFSRGLDESHFDMVAAHFAATLRDLQVKPDLIDKAIAVLAPLRPIFQRGARIHQRIKAKKKKTIIRLALVAAAIAIVAIIIIIIAITVSRQES
mmetsp:Transcript_33741/g.107835  ORF Transcript_33741/g.107835 Transcript_33741/m.107835 type:complete len:117 (-) Transcript_33741:151-501(-)